MCYWINLSPILCISDFELQCKHLEKFKSNCATKNRRRKSKVFCMYVTVDLRFPIPTFLDRRATDLQLTWLCSGLCHTFCWKIFDNRHSDATPLDIWTNNTTYKPIRIRQNRQSVLTFLTIVGVFCQFLKVLISVPPQVSSCVLNPFLIHWMHKQYFCFWYHRKCKTLTKLKIASIKL